jgi:hypothetical protein
MGSKKPDPFKGRTNADIAEEYVTKLRKLHEGWRQDRLRLATRAKEIGNLLIEAEKAISEQSSTASAATS